MYASDELLTRAEFDEGKTKTQEIQQPQAFQTILTFRPLLAKFHKSGSGSDNQKSKKNELEELDTTSEELVRHNGVGFDPVDDVEVGVEVKVADTARSVE